MMYHSFAAREQLLVRNFLDHQERKPATACLRQSLCLLGFQCRMDHDYFQHLRVAPRLRKLRQRGHGAGDKAKSIRNFRHRPEIDAPRLASPALCEKGVQLLLCRSRRVLGRDGALLLAAYRTLCLNATTHKPEPGHRNIHRPVGRFRANRLRVRAKRWPAAKLRHALSPAERLETQHITPERVLGVVLRHPAAFAHGEAHLDPIPVPSPKVHNAGLAGAETGRRERPCG
mmetsp:Transcript_19310/g.61878  ORF Transcript_19310/g.61878 Transcript_19310/m.61878 type:complete len:230 (+) Transcript_19310:593-1282(+)